MTKADERRALGPPEIAKRYGLTDELSEHQKQERVRKLREELAALEDRPKPMAVSHKLSKGTSEPSSPHVKALRLRTGLTQAQFAELHGFNRRSLEGWEAGRSHPGKAAKRKLAEIDDDLAKEGK